MEDNLGLQKQPNPNKKLVIAYKDNNYKRLPIKTRLVNIGDSYLELVKDFVLPYYREGDFLIISEKIIGISQKRVLHSSEVKPGWLANTIVKYTTKYKDDVAWEDPRKMQAAIKEAGYFRIITATIIGGIMKFLFKQPGWFWRIAGPNIEAIDGFNPIAIPPFNEYALLAPDKPDQVTQEIEDKFGIPNVIVDASNVAVHILGSSSGLQQLGISDSDIKSIIADNPAGQSAEQTPLILVRKV